ncbi:unnamed protein product [Rotaria socialis]
MSSNLFYDSDDERDSFDIERRQIESFQKQFLSASIESSDDDDEGIIDGTKIPSSTKVKSRARHAFLDVSILSSSSEQELQIDDENPFDIISKSIDIEHIKPVKKKKSLGVSKSKIQLETLDIYEQDDSNSRSSFPSKIDDEEEIQSNKTKTNNKSKVRKPTKGIVLETERKMQQLSRSEQLVLPTFVPKPLETWHALEKRSRLELMNEIRAKNPSFTPQDPELPELPVVNIESTVVSTLADLTKLIEDKPKSSDKLSKLSRFLNPDILKKKPTMSNIMKESNTMIDLNDTKKAPNYPTMKSALNISLDSNKSPSSSKKLFDMQKQLGIRMQVKRAAMLADNPTNVQIEDEDEDVKEIEDDSSDSNDDADSEIISEIDKENDDLQVDEESAHLTNDEDEIEEEEDEETEEKENTNPSSDPNRPSLKTILTRLESSSESVHIQPNFPWFIRVARCIGSYCHPLEQDGKAEWFNSSRPAQFDSELEMLCSGAFDGDNIIAPSQNFKHTEPIAFSPLPATQIEEEPDIEVRRPKVRQLIDDDDEDQTVSNKQSSSGSNNVEEEEEDEDGFEDNEELVDFKKQLFEMEAEESGSEADEKEKEKDDESDDDDDEEPDEELRQFIDTGAIEVDEDEADDMAKVHLKIKAKEDEQQLKLLKEQYLDFDGDDDGRRIKISKNMDDDDDEEYDPDYNSEDGDDDDDEDEDEDPMDMKDRFSELERQRSIQDNQAEELHLNEDLDSIGQNSSMFQKGLALKQKKLQSTTMTHIESTTQTITDTTTRKGNQARSVTLSSVLLAKRFSSTLLAPMNRNNVTVATLKNTDEAAIKTKKQHNPRRHVFATNLIVPATNENENPAPSTTSSGEKRANSADKSPKKNIKRFKQTTAATAAAAAAAAAATKAKESSTSVFSALAFSNTRH